MTKKITPRFDNLIEGDKIEITRKGKRVVVEIVGSPYHDDELELDVVETSKDFITRDIFTSLKPKRVGGDVRR